MQTRRQQYTRYLKSPEWREKRAQVIFRDGRRCLWCGTGGKGLEVHHLTYERFGHESLADLITLCHNCHTLAHAKNNGLVHESALA